MKRSLFSHIFSIGFFLIALFPAAAFPSTCIDGIGTDVYGPIWQDTTWTQGNSPYCITQNITVMENMTLTIEPGVEVIFWEGREQHLDNQYNLIIQGQLFAAGTQQDRIIFTSSLNNPSPGNWGQIEFTETSVPGVADDQGEYQSGSILSFVTIEYGGILSGGSSQGPGGWSVVIASQSPYISDVTISNNHGGGIQLLQPAEIMRSTFENNRGSALAASSTLEVYNSSFVNNTGLLSSYVDQYNQSHGAILGGAIFSNGPLIVSNSIFENNKATSETTSTTSYYSWALGGAIYCNNNLQVSNSTFENNKTYAYYQYSNDAQSYGGAIFARWDSAEINIINSTFLNNANEVGSEYDDNYGSGGAIYSKSDVSVDSSTFTGNSTIGKGGAICSEGAVTVTNADFTQNVVNTAFETAHGGAISAQESSTITGSNFINNSITTRTLSYAYGSAVACNSDLTITNSVFNNNALFLEYAEDVKGGVAYIQGTASLANCRFENNSITSSNYIREVLGGVLYGISTISLSEVDFRNNFYIGHQGHEKYTMCHTYSGNPSSILSSNFINNRGYKEILYVTNNTIQNSLFYFNQADTIVYIPYGEVSNSTIVNNSGAGLHTYGSQAGTATIQWCNIYNNSPYNINHSHTSDVLAHYNYWGTQDPSDIFLYIYDYWDNQSFGEVDFGLFENNFLTQPTTTAPRLPFLAIEDELIVSFSGNGLWHYNGTHWNQLNDQTPETMVNWNGGLAADFGGNGLWNHDGSNWSQLTGRNPEDICSWTGGIAVAFSEGELWNYTGNSWELLTLNHAENMQDWFGGLAVDFGTFGLWNYNGSTWELMTTSDPEQMTAWHNGLAVDFGAFGLWNHSSTNWDLLTTSDAESMQAWAEGLAVDFGVFGLWHNNGADWVLLTTSDAQIMAAWGDSLAVEFGTIGFWSYDSGGWELMTTTTCEAMTGWGNSIVADFGPTGLWTHDGSAWELLSGWDADGMTDVDLE